MSSECKIHEIITSFRKSVNELNQKQELFVLIFSFVVPVGPKPILASKAEQTFLTRTKALLNHGSGRTGRAKKLPEIKSAADCN